MERYALTLSKIRKMISAGELGSGGRLPPERELAQALGVGRRSLRRALDVLEGEGQLSRRQGRGTFVTSSDIGEAGPLNGVFEHTNPLEVMEVRLSVEPTIARLASLRASRCDISRLRRLVEETRNARNSTDYQQADATFHRAIAEAARNTLFLALYDALHALRKDATWERLSENGRCYKRQAVYANDHREIFEAIAERDSERAQEVMYNHLSDVQRSLFQHAFPASTSRSVPAETVNGS